MQDFTHLLQFWLNKFHEGHIAARNELIRHSQERLRVLTQQMLRRYPGVQQWEDANDVLQNVLVRIDRALQAVKVASPRDFLRLATTQIRRELIDLARHYSGTRRAKVYLGEAGDVATTDTAAEPEDNHADLDDLARWHDLHCQIASLEDEDRELFELLYYQGLTQSDAAVLMNIPFTTFKRRWRFARIRLMIRLEGELPF